MTGPAVPAPDGGPDPPAGPEFGSEARSARQARQARGRVRYEFLLAGRVSKLVVAAFPELTVAVSPAGGTALFGPVTDDAQLYGLLDRFQTFGLTVVELRQLPD